LHAEGTATERIVITSAAGIPSPGDWDYIKFYEGAGDNSVMAYCDIMYGGGYGTNHGMVIVEESGLAMQNCVVSHSENQGVELEVGAMFTDCSANSFSENGTFPIEVRGSYAHTIGSDNTFQQGTAILVKGDKIEHADVTWVNPGIPYAVDGTVDLGSATGAKLTIEAGTRVGFTAYSEMRVGYSSGKFGILVADGEHGNEITFTSAAPEGFEAAGDWDGIWLYDGTGNGTLFDHCIFAYGGGYGVNTGILTIRVTKSGVPEITNCQFIHSAAWGIFLDRDADPAVSGNTFGNNKGGEVRTPG
jgi:parallel beta-helix repeat protein